MLPLSSISKGQNLCRVILLTKTSTGKDVVEPADAIRWSHIVLSGGRRPRTTARPTHSAMLAFKNLNDRKFAEIV